MRKLLLGASTLLFLFLFPLVESDATVMAATVRCAYSSFAQACQIKGSCPSGTQPESECPLNCSSDFDINCISSTIKTPAPTPFPTDCTQQNGDCQQVSAPCSGSVVASSQCSAQTDSTGSPFKCCLPGTRGTAQPLFSQPSGSTISCTPAGGAKDTGISTAIGCIPALSSNPADLMAFILRWAIGVAGGIAFLLILYAGFQIMTSSGDPQRLKAGQELLTAAISGLLMLIFSVFILRVIGVNILGIF